MQFNKYILLVALTMCFVTMSSAQHKVYDIRNGFAAGGGITQYDIITDNFNTSAATGWALTAAATADLPHKWYTVSFGMQLSENRLDISGRISDDVQGDEAIEYKLMMAQVSFILHMKLLGDNITLDFGPQLQYNGKLELKDEAQENYFINNYDMLMAKDIQDISQFNVNGVVGASAGFGSFRIRAQYSYGVTNILDKLNDQNLNVGNNTAKFKGNQSMITVAALITF